MKITYFGTTTLLFDDGKNRILFDAHFTRHSFLKCLLRFKVSTNSRVIIEKTEDNFDILSRYCEKNDINCIVQLPCTSIEI